MHFANKLGIALHSRSVCVLLVCVLVSLPAGIAAAGITIQFDYTYDSTGLFAEGSEARETLEWVGEFYSSLLDDDLTAIDSSGDNHYDILFVQPDTGMVATVYDYDVPADTLVVFAGAKNSGGAILAQAGPGAAYVTGDSSWETNVKTRGEGSVVDVEGLNASEVAIWGGSVMVDSGVNWNYDHAALPEEGEYDFGSVLLHEFGHMLGFGIVDSWGNATDGVNQFIGSATVAANGRYPVPLSVDWMHWEDGVTSNNVFGTDVAQRALMEPYLSTGTKLWAAALDIAAIDDIGWDINPVDAWRGASGAVFSSATNWSTGVSPGGRDSVRFDMTGSREVSFVQDVRLQQISMELGQVTFALGGHTLETDLLWATGNGTSLNVEGGTLLVDVFAKVESGSTLTVGSAGRLELAASTLDGDLTINSGGELLGGGVVTGTLHHQAGGIVSPGGSGQVGSLAVVGDYLQANDSILKIDLFGLNDYDTLTVENTVSLAGDLVIDLGPTFTVSEGDLFTILTCTDLSGEFDSISADLSYGNLGLSVLYDYEMKTVSLVALSPSIPGDANRDGLVDGSDVTILAGNWQAGVEGGGATWEMGDFNGDGQVDGSDVTILAGNWQAGVTAAATAVPEPSAIVLLILLLCGSGVMSRNARRSSQE